jgi:antitoxin (DNA-binding transcriptional repressor) of toxin-antitoxin stability system
MRTVRQGETIAVLDRDTPVALIVPFRDRPALRVQCLPRGPRRSIVSACRSR